MSDDRVHREDIDDLIGVAVEIKEKDEESLSVEDIEEVALELDIEPEYVEQARTELQRRREEQAQREAKEKRKAAARKKWMIGGGVGVTAIFGIWSVATLSSLGSLHSEVEARRAQVQNVRERKRAIAEQLEGRPDSVDKDAELVGSENRIRVEAQRYAEAAARYNEAARSFPAPLVRPLSGLPAEVPLKVE